MASHPIFLGNASQFAIELGFEPDPDNGQGASREMAASWGFLRIWARGQNLCYRMEDGQPTMEVHWYLLPFLEWLAENWDPLLHEEKLPFPHGGQHAWSGLRLTSPARTPLDEAWAQKSQFWQQWWQRHALHACREGGIFPDVVFRRCRGEVEISWGPSQVAGAREEFRMAGLPEGFQRFAPALVAGPLYAALKKAVASLRERLADSPRMAELERKVLGIPGDAERNEIRLAWMAGLGSTVEAMRQRLRELKTVLGQRFGPEAEALFGVAGAELALEGCPDGVLLFGSASPSIGDADVLTLARHMLRTGEEPDQPPPLADFVQFVSLSGSPDLPWDQGYRLAENFLEDAGILDDSIDFVDVRGLYAHLGIPVHEEDFQDEHIRAVAIARPDRAPKVLVNRRNRHNAGEAGYRFTLAHELCHLLHDREYGAGLAQISGPWAPAGLEKRAGAFAAMLLMPLELIERYQDRFDVGFETREDVENAAETLRVSPSSLLDHLMNLERITQETRQAILSSLWEGQDHPMELRP